MENEYYTILGVNRWASQKAVERAFRSRIFAIHPDRNPEDEAVAERARQLIEAYEVLKDPVKRNQYDRTMPTPAHLFAPYSYRERECPLWVTQFLVIFLFFAFSAGAFYVVAAAFSYNGPVFRPSAETIMAARSLHSKSAPTLEKGDRGSSLQLFSMKEAPSTDPLESITVH